ncbi:hypothetical protein V8V91_01865 [Algoriphagus halophilus]|uniref:hypothetical protein n=1 Tax=Algoriphagus halophilus TaxID=226505 RepID=UPI00358F10FE
MKNIDFFGLHTQFFLDHGFEINQNYMLFQKSFPIGSQVIFVHHHEDSRGTCLEYNLGIRIHQVEELIHEFLPTLSGFSERSITLVQSQEKISKNIPRSFIIHGEEELTDVLHRGENFLLTDGIPWLDKMIDPLNLEIAFFERKSNFFKSHNFVYNAFRATALSKLFNPKDYPYLRQLFLEHIEEKQMTPFTIASFLKFLDYLDKLD